jgi:hypothetical protein
MRPDMFESQHEWHREANALPYLHKRDPDAQPTASLLEIVPEIQSTQAASQ